MPRIGGDAEDAQKRDVNCCQERAENAIGAVADGAGKLWLPDHWECDPSLDGEVTAEWGTVLAPNDHFTRGRSPQIGLGTMAELIRTGVRTGVIDWT